MIKSNRKLLTHRPIKIVVETSKILTILLLKIYQFSSFITVVLYSEFNQSQIIKLCLVSLDPLLHLNTHVCKVIINKILYKKNIIMMFPHLSRKVDFDTTSNEKFSYYWLKVSYFKQVCSRFKKKFKISLFQIYKSDYRSSYQ